MDHNIDIVPDLKSYVDSMDINHFNSTLKFLQYDKKDIKRYYFLTLYKEWRIKAIKELKVIYDAENNPNDKEIKFQHNQFVSYFEPFIYNWIAFNVCYSFYRINSEKHFSEARCIERLGQSNFLQIKKVILSIFRSESFSQLLHTPYQPTEALTKMARQLKKLENNDHAFYVDVDKNTHLIYDFMTTRLRRVRNHLFHGKKSPENEQDRMIVSFAATLLNHFLSLVEMDILQHIIDNEIDP